MKRFTLALIAAVGMGISAAQAAPVTIQDNPNVRGSSVFADGLFQTVRIQSNRSSSPQNVSAGVFALQFGDGAGNFQDFLTFCLQVTETLTLPKDHELVNNLSYMTDADEVALGTAYGNFMTEDYALRDGLSAAAMQAMIWEISEDGVANFDLTTGAFALLSDAVRDRAEEFWVLLESGTLPVFQFSAYAALGTQDLITTETPLPGAALFMGTGLAVWARKRRKRATA